MVVAMRGSTAWGKRMEKESTYGRMAVTTMVNGKITKLQGKESTSGRMGEGMRVSG